MVAAACAVAFALPVRAEPAPSEWTYWYGASVGTRRLAGKSVVAGQGSLGLEATFHLATFGSATQYGGAYELRWGPWMGSSFGPREAIGEAGLKCHWSQLEHAQWGTFELRLGGGYGLTQGVPGPHFVATVAGGVRSFLDRYKPPPPPAVSIGSVLRLFATTRVRPGSRAPWDLVFGIEFEPSIFGPPYSWSRIGGARP